MIKLPLSEEQLMQYIWDTPNCFAKDLLELYPEPKPAQTTLATLLKRLHEKNSLTIKLTGIPDATSLLLQKETYFESHLNTMVKQHFNDSALSFASFFTKKSKMSKSELQQLKNIVEQQLNK